MGRPITLSHMEIPEVADLLLGLAASSLAERGAFSLVVSGGSTPKALYQRMRTERADWKSWIVVLGDDRCLNETHPDRNENMVRSAWINHVPIGRFVGPPAGLDPNESSAAFAQSIGGIGMFDLCLLGMGLDGHTAGLFSPKHLALAGDVIGHVDGPPPHSARVTLSASRLRKARRTIFLVGPEKEKIVKELIAKASVIPFDAAAPQRSVIVITEPATLQQIER